MSVTIPAPRRAYDDEPVTVLPCTECLDLIEVDELRDCGTHRLCQSCLADSPCSGCRTLRHEEAADMVDDRAYDAWRDRETTHDWENPR